MYFIHHGNNVKEELISDSEQNLKYPKLFIKFH